MPIVACPTPRRPLKARCRCRFEFFIGCPKQLRNQRQVLSRVLNRTEICPQAWLVRHPLPCGLSDTLGAPQRPLEGKKSIPFHCLHKADSRSMTKTTTECPTELKSAPKCGLSDTLACPTPPSELPGSPLKAAAVCGLTPFTACTNQLQA